MTSCCHSCSHPIPAMAPTSFLMLSLLPSPISASLCFPSTGIHGSLFLHPIWLVFTYKINCYYDVFLAILQFSDTLHIPLTRYGTTQFTFMVMDHDTMQQNFNNIYPRKPSTMAASSASSQVSAEMDGTTQRPSADDNIGS